MMILLILFQVSSQLNSDAKHKDPFHHQALKRGRPSKSISKGLFRDQKTEIGSSLFTRYAFGADHLHSYTTFSILLRQNRSTKNPSHLNNYILIPNDVAIRIDRHVTISTSEQDKGRNGEKKSNIALKIERPEARDSYQLLGHTLWRSINGRSYLAIENHGNLYPSCQAYAS